MTVLHCARPEDGAQLLMHGSVCLSERNTERDRHITKLDRRSQTKLGRGDPTGVGSRRRTPHQETATVLGSSLVATTRFRNKQIFDTSGVRVRRFQPQRRSQEVPQTIVLATRPSDPQFYSAFAWLEDIA